MTATGQFFRIESLNILQCYPATIGTLQQLHAKGCGLYLLSNAQRIFTEYELRSLGLWDLFDGILISSDEGCCKPDPAFFRSCLTATD
ncbi:HAD family hydrolase [Waltera sp.]|uniref:HAD family hydrolase n=1 Tax=Waltera sp. TaxID=2815806 RepID=UPI003AF153D3